MFTDHEERSGSLADTCRRSGRRAWRAGAAPRVIVLVAVLAACLLAAGPAGAQAPPRDGTMFVHSAKSGELGGGSLTLHGVGRRVTCGPQQRPLRGDRRQAAASEALLADDPGGDRHAARGGPPRRRRADFRLSRPRYNPSRRTVSYRVKRTNNGRLPSRAARAAGVARQFGPASLSIVGAPQPSVDVQQTTYSCNGGDTCWGTLSASGLPPGSSLSGFAPQVPGNTGQGVESTFGRTGTGTSIHSSIFFAATAITGPTRT